MPMFILDLLGGAPVVPRRIDETLSMPRISTFLRTTAIVLASAALPLAASSGAQAASLDPLGFQIEVPSGGISVQENAGQAVVTVQRSELASLTGAQVRYITSGDGFNPSTNAPFDCGGTPCTATSDDF